MVANQILLGMSNRWRRIWAWVGMLGLVVIGLAIARYVWTAKKKPDAVSVVAGLVAVLVAIAPLVRWLRKRQRPDEPPSDDFLNLAADRLAKQVDDQWSDAAGDRGLLAPAPMPVRWRWCEGVTNRPADAVGRSRFEPLPGFSPASTEDVQAGGLTDLLKVFGGLPSGRIVIVGEPGSGKSAAAILLLLDVLKYRRGLGPDERALVPVPVLFTLRGWRPDTQSVQDWLARELTRTYPFFQACGPAVTRGMITSNRLAFFLDGLDELPPALHAPALEALNTQATTFRLLVLSRSKEMVDAVDRLRHISDAAALELVPIPASVAADYLTSTRHLLPGRWKRLVDYLRTHPDGAVSSVLNSPLTVTLVRDTYRDGGNPAELLDGSRLGEPADVEDYLLDRVLPAAYTQQPGEAPPRYSLDAATRALAYIAARMNQDHTRDLAWWKVPRWVVVAPRLIITGFLFGLLFGLIFGLGRGSVVGLVAGLITALLQALGQAGLLEPLRGPKRLGTIRWRTLLSRNSVRAAPAIGLAFGIMGWIIAGLAYALAFGLVATLVVGFALGISQPGTEESPSDPLSCWRNDRNFGLLVAPAVGLVAGVGLGLTLGRGLLYGLVAGLVAGLVGGLFYPDTWRTAVACGQLSLAGHTPLRLMRFLEDAYARNVLRSVGPVYQFRHASLQDRLAGPLVVKIRDVQWENWRNIALIAALHVEITNTTDRPIRLSSFTFTTDNRGKPPWEHQASADERIAVEREIHARQVGFRYGLSLRNHDEVPAHDSVSGWLVKAATHDQRGGIPPCTVIVRDQIGKQYTATKSGRKVRRPTASS